MKLSFTKLKATFKKLLQRPKQLYQAYRPNYYHIHIGWFGGLCIYPKHPYSELQNHECR